MLSIQQQYYENMYIAIICYWNLFLQHFEHFWWQTMIKVSIFRHSCLQLELLCSSMVSLKITWNIFWIQTKQHFWPSCSSNLLILQISSLSLAVVRKNRNFLHFIWALEVILLAGISVQTYVVLSHRASHDSYYHFNLCALLELNIHCWPKCVKSIYQCICVQDAFSLFLHVHVQKWKEFWARLFIYSYTE